MENIRIIRKQRNMTMKELGKAVGCAESAISLYETGKRDPDIKTLLRIASVLDVGIEDLIGTNPPPIPSKRQEAAAMLAELSQEELDQVVSYAEFLKAKRK